MRQLLHGDVTFAARALLRVPKERRVRFLYTLFIQAEHADQFRLSSGKAHVLWGNGSLMSVAARHPLAQERGFDCAEYCDCVMIVVAAAKALAEGKLWQKTAFSTQGGFDSSDVALD